MFKHSKMFTTRVVHVKFEENSFACEVSPSLKKLNISALWTFNDLNPTICDKKSLSYITIYSQACIKHKYLCLGLHVTDNGI